MDLRTKLVFALVGASLLSMLALGSMAYDMADDRLTRKTQEQLTSLAGAKSEDLENVVEGWKDRVSLIASRTQLRVSLDTFDVTGDPDAPVRIRRILEDVLGASDAVAAATVYGLDGRVVTGVAREGRLEVAPPDSLVPFPAGGDVRLEGVHLPESDTVGPVVHFVAPLRLDARTVGALRVTLETGELAELTDDGVGLGATGEIMVVARDSAGAVRVLTPRRHAPTPMGSGRRSPPDGEAPEQRALRGEEGLFTEGLVDYRGQPVWAAIRLLPETGWALIVKFDAAEERRPVVEFRNQLVKVGFALSAFAILFGTLLGLGFARPIHDLAAVANRVRMGELGARAEVTREDELGLLGLTFNEMSEELERRMELLREYKKFFDLSPDMLCIAGTDGYFKRVNPAFERTLGWPIEELVERPFVEFVHPDDVDATIRETERLSQGIPTVSFQNRYRCQDGSYKRLQWTCYPDPRTDFLYAVARHVPDAPDAGEPTPG